MTPEEVAAAIMDAQRRGGVGVDFLVAVGPEVHIIHQGQKFMFTVEEEP